LGKTFFFLGGGIPQRDAQIKHCETAIAASTRLDVFTELVGVAEETRNSADKPRDALLQYAMARRTP